MELNIIEKVNNEQEQVVIPKVHNCLSCQYAFASDSGVECRRRESEGVVITLTEDQIFMNCAARDADGYKTRISSKYLDWIEERDYKTSLRDRQDAYRLVMNDIVGGD
jgi:hypothetical protein